MFTLENSQLFNRGIRRIDNVWQKIMKHWNFPCVIPSRLHYIFQFVSAINKLVIVSTNVKIPQNVSFRIPTFADTRRGFLWPGLTASKFEQLRHWKQRIPFVKGGQKQMICGGCFFPRLTEAFYIWYGLNDSEILKSGSRFVFSNDSIERNPNLKNFQRSF